MPQNLFELYVEEIFSYLRGNIFKRFIESDKFTRQENNLILVNKVKRNANFKTLSCRFCQWKNLELNSMNNMSMNDFSVHRIIGRGGFGEVYGCRKADTGKMYAMKVMDHSHLSLLSHNFSGRGKQTLPHKMKLTEYDEVNLCVFYDLFDKS